MLLQAVFFFALILQDMLPEHINMRIAESILFAGKAVRVLRNPSSAFRFQDQQITRSSQKIQGFTARISFQKEPLVDMKLVGEELFPQSDADKIEAMLQGLKVFSPLIIVENSLLLVLF